MGLDRQCRVGGGLILPKAIPPKRLEGLARWWGKGEAAGLRYERPCDSMHSCPTHFVKALRSRVGVVGMPVCEKDQLGNAVGAFIFVCATCLTGAAATQLRRRLQIRS